MKNKTVLLSFAGLALVVVAAFLAQGGKTEAPVTSSTSSQTETNSQQASDSSAQPSNAEGQYLDYSETAVATAQGQKILFFHAPWCPQCRALEESIISGSIPSGLSIFKVDYDTSTKLKQKYGVTLQTTLVKINESGELVEKYVAYSDPTLESLKSNLLD